MKYFYVKAQDLDAHTKKKFHESSQQSEGPGVGSISLRCDNQGYLMRSSHKEEGI